MIHGAIREINMVDIEYLKVRIMQLCDNFSLPTPKINHALPEDPCDYTAPYEIRLNPEAAGPDIVEDYYSRNVFGHWICDLHAIPKYSDKVADVIAELLD